MKKSFISQRNIRGVAFLVMITLLVAILCVTHVGNARAASGNESALSIGQSRVTPTNGALSPFIGTWYKHGEVLNIASNGSASFYKRAYRWCGPGVAKPCDTMKGNVIINGIQMQIQFTQVKGSYAYGHIISATTQDTNHQVTLALNHNHTATFTEDKRSPLQLNEVLCDLQAPVGTCGA